MSNLRMVLGVAGAIGAVLLMDGNAGAAVVQTARGACVPPNIWLQPGDETYVAALDHSADHSGYCARQGTVTDAGTQALDGAAAAWSSFVAWVSSLSSPASSPSSSPDGPITSPDQVPNAGPVNSAQWDPLSEADA